MIKSKIVSKIILIICLTNFSAQPKEDFVSRISEDEIEYIAQCVEAEAYNQGMDGMMYVTDCILNRYDTGKYENIYSVINAPNQFSVVASGTIYRWKPEDDVVEMIEHEINFRTNSEIKYFRTGSYHNFGTPVLKYKEHYFSK